MAELPKSIRVGYRDYTVEEWPANLASVSNRWGECDRRNLGIRIQQDLLPAMRAEVLLHEVIHAAYEMGALDEKDGEERIACVLGNQLTQVWRDNPELIAFMSESLTPA